MNFVELLAPARDLQSAVAAVDYGADARLYRRCKVRSAPCGGQQCGADRPCRGVCPPLWRAGACHAQYPDLRRRTGDPPSGRPRADRGRGRCAHSCRTCSAADGSSGRAARLDAGVQHDARTGAFLRRMRFRSRDSRTGAVARRDPGDMAPRRTPKWSVSSTGPSAWVTAAAVFCRGRCPGGAATAAHAASRAA